MKKLFVVTETCIDFDGGNLDDIDVDTSVELFDNLKDAQKFMQDEVENAVEDFCYGDEDDMENFGEDGYSEKYIEEMKAHVEVWNEDGGGKSVKLTIKEKELGD